MDAKIALYPGTFDPITNGHISLIERGLKVFDRILVAVAADTPKETLFTLEERVEMVRLALKEEKRISVESYTGLTVDYALQRKSCALLR
ncbi:MAG: adenylyltransferase/cytidyltransferase family protein, partial [Desulfovibrio sp.]|nr:adenylyltransferase/cytidyltransferase family protein [Desulfovibrio sp.]